MFEFGAKLCERRTSASMRAKQLIEIEGLGEIVVGAHLEALDLVLQRIHGGEHQDGRVVALKAQALADVVAVHVGQHQIEHDDVELPGLGEVDPFGAGGGDGNPMILRAEPAVDEVGDARLVFNQEHVHALPSALSAGNATVTVVPSPGRLAISILPL